MACTLTTEEVAHIDRTIADLKDENARLRSCMSDDADNARLILGENAKLRRDLEEANSQAEEVCIENAKLRQLVRDVVLLAGVNGCDVTKMQLCVHGGDWRTVWERMRELGVDG